MLSKFIPARWLGAIQRLGLPWAGMAAALLALLIGLSGAWQALELKLFDRMVVATAPNRVDMPITLVGIDEPSFAELKRQWPWPRSLHAKLLDNLREAGVAAVGFDVVFAEPSSPQEDAAFAQAIRKSGNVVLAADLVYSETNGTRQWLRVEPYKPFVEAGAVPGFASVQLDPDGVQRKVPVVRDAFWREVLVQLDKAHPGVVAQFDATPDMRIRYLGGPHTFNYIPYYQLLDPDKYLPPNWKDYLKDNIVLIGRNLKATTEVGSAQADMFQTPFLAASNELMPGVEIHANLIADMAGGTVIRAAPASWKWLLWLATAALSLLLMRRWQPVKSGVAGLVLIAAIGGGDFALFSQKLIWLPAASALLTVTLIYLAQGGVAYFLEQRQRRQIKRAFSMYVAPAVVEEVIAHPELLKLGGERRDLTLLFTDLAGFTSISEALDAEQVANILNRHLTEMTEIVLRYHGTVDKFIGDAVMAFWGAPIPDAEQSLHAVKAAVEMQEKIAAMREEVAAAGGPDLHMRIGVHRGECIVGNMGGDNRFDYTAIGDTVNLASRLEGVNKVYNTGILLSETVAEAVAGQLALRQVDTVRVKGKHVGVRIFTPCPDEMLAARTASALAAYQAGDWALAQTLWSDILAAFPGDPVALTFLHRLETYRSAGWPEPWDGITTLESK
ncbi:MAG: adenylate/guanylate cyclase domain-containing protein [Sulfuricellaceae bacterium]|nr:adenylate/guanylate cyclase domain-containing protein [Sulfuricellaceae bacterium]